MFIFSIGMHEAAHHKQTMMHLKSLMTSMERYNCNNDIRHHLAKICRLVGYFLIQHYNFHRNSLKK